MNKLVAKTEMKDKEWNNSLPCPLLADVVYAMADEQPENPQYVNIINVDGRVHNFEANHFVPYNPAAEKVLPALRKKRNNLTLSKLIEEKFM